MKDVAQPLGGGTDIFSQMGHATVEVTRSTPSDLCCARATGPVLPEPPCPRIRTRVGVGVDRLDVVHTIDVRRVRCSVRCNPGCCFPSFLQVFVTRRDIRPTFSVNDSFRRLCVAVLAYLRLGQCLGPRADQWELRTDSTDPHSQPVEQDSCAGSRVVGVGRVVGISQRHMRDELLVLAGVFDRADQQTFAQIFNPFTFQEHNICTLVPEHTPAHRLRPDMVRHTRKFLCMA